MSEFNTEGRVLISSQVSDKAKISSCWSAMNSLSMVGLSRSEEMEDTEQVLR